MTNEDFELEKQKIINEFGKPERDWDPNLWNESAKRIKALTERKRMEALADKRKAKQEYLADLFKDIPKEQYKQIMKQPLPAIYIEDHDLKAFQDIEKEIIRYHFENRDSTNKELATYFNTNPQRITALFHSIQFKALEIKYHEARIPAKLRNALERLVDADHEKTVLRLSEHYGIVKAEKQDINITSKPIEDPEAIRLLRELGDRVADAPKNEDPQ